jgi:nitrite reductase (NADH) small subunit
MSEWVRLCSRSELPPAGDAREIDFGHRILCVANHHGNIAVIQNECPHHGGPLGQGIIESDKIVCPWHAWAFDLNSGTSTHSSNVKVEVYEVAVEGDDVKIHI